MLQFTGNLGIVTSNYSLFLKTGMIPFSSAPRMFFCTKRNGAIFSRLRFFSGFRFFIFSPHPDGRRPFLSGSFLL